jgi:hypothetical protein
MRCSNGMVVLELRINRDPAAGAVEVQMHRILSEQLPAVHTHFSSQTMAHVSALHGPEPGLASMGVFSPETAPHWNIHAWEWR